MKFLLPMSLLLTFFASGYALSAESTTPINAYKVSTQCLSNKWQKSDLLQLKEDKFSFENKTEKEALALQLLHCLSSPEPTLRDGIAFEALSYWLRNDQLSQSIYIQMFDHLTHVLNSNVEDLHGVYQSFSMLTLSEVARVDRKSLFLTDKQRGYLVKVGTDYLTNLKDYRGFSEKVGWRHAVAHSSDLMLQLALNPAVTKTQLNIMLESLASQISAHDQHYYINGEPKRIAMAVLYIFLRGEHSQDDWSNWLKSVTEPSPFKKWQDVYQSNNGLTKLHNTQSFLYALYATIKPSKNAILAKMIPGLEIAIKEVN
jgi:hypothetical protein